MKKIIIATLLSAALLACKKSAPVTENKNQVIFLRVEAVGVDTTRSPIAIVKM